MHERNIYRDCRPDFRILSEEYPRFAKHVMRGQDGKCHINFRDAEAVKELSCALLMKDFKLDVDIPLDRLIPTIPLRLNYVHWVEDLLGPDRWKNSSVRGVDIEIGQAAHYTMVAGMSFHASSSRDGGGKCPHASSSQDGGEKSSHASSSTTTGCGASCIYPLLGARINEWNFVASEIDDKSFEFAKKNVERNKLNEKIDVIKVDKEDILMAVVNDEHSFDFTMCNPPFFSDRWEASGESTRTERRPLPLSISTASEDESITQGGEVEFVKRIITESTVLKDKISWFTSLLGKKSSLKILIRHLRECKVPVVTSTEFQQGRTTRWGVAWSFSDSVEVPVVKKKNKNSKKKQKPFIFSIPKLELERRACMTHFKDEFQKVVDDIQKYLDDLEIKYCSSIEKKIDDSSVWQFTGKVYQNTWKYQRKKRRENLRKAKVEKSGSLEIPKAIDDEGKQRSEECGEKEIRESASNKTSSLISDTEKSEVNVSDSSIALESNSKFSSETNLTEIGLKRKLNDSCEIQTESKHRTTGSSPEMKDEQIMKESADDSINLQLKQTPTENRQLLFEFVISVAEMDYFNVKSDNSPVGVSFFCAEGNREQLHQLFLYFKNQFSGTQVHEMK